ncbi:nuclear transport factor 2 family protein [Tolypothrix sp. VBCCA 56010]|uniref:nuclear transport factor 2 family protein n=1 Tax=Tolypothrix sp. VBCCA 56010 TaxID=3137731 RepID=UPI003D7DAFB5
MNTIDIQRIVDQTEIINLLNRFVLSIDTRDYTTMRACLTNEVNFDYSALFGTIMPSAADELIEDVRQNHAGFRGLQHLTANHFVIVDGDSATCTANFIAHHFLPNDRGGNSWTLGGRYDYQLTQTETGWKISGCTIHVSWTDGNLQLFDLARQYLS